MYRVGGIKVKKSDAALELAKKVQSTLPDMQDFSPHHAHWVITYLEEMGMAPPGYMKPIPFEADGKQYPLIPGDFPNDKDIWCTPGVRQWEEEDFSF